MSLQSSKKDVLEALGQGPNYPTYRAKGQVHRANTTIQRWSEVRAGPEGSPHPGPRMSREGQEPDSKLGTAQGPAELPH